MMNADYEARLRELLDKQEIMDLVQTYCNAADRHDHEKMRALYHDDATDYHGIHFQGLAMEFIDKLPEIQEPMEILHHNVTTVNIKLDGDYAEGEVYLIAFHRYRSEDQGPVDLLIGGRYFDNYERRNGVWKFSNRATAADWAQFDAPSRVAMQHPIVAGAYNGVPGPNDPSYQFYKLFRFGER